MKIRIITVLLVGILFSCSKSSTDEYSISGVAQKGPFIKGSQIEISELTDLLVQTGKTFKTELKNDLGEFEISGLTLESTKVEITTDGYYYNEMSGELSQSRLVLKSLSDISNKESVNVNIMTHIIVDRLKTLIKSGKTYQQAKTQAQNELLSLFNIDSDSKVPVDFENMDISNQENGILIAISSIFQGNNSVAELSKLLADFKADFSNNGLIDNVSIQTELMNNAMLIDPGLVKSNVEKYYENLGLDIDVPDFKQHIKGFIDSVDFESDLKISYPSMGSYGENLLAKESNSEILQNTEYSIVTVFPTGIHLTVYLKINKIDGNVDIITEESKQTNWYGLPIQDGEPVKADGIGDEADFSIIFTGTGGVEIEVEVFDIFDQYIETKSIYLTVK